MGRNQGNFEELSCKCDFNLCCATFEEVGRVLGDESRVRARVTWDTYNEVWWTRDHV